MTIDANLVHSGVQMHTLVNTLVNTHTVDSGWSENSLESKGSEERPIDGPAREDVGIISCLEFMCKVHVPGLGCVSRVQLPGLGCVIRSRFGV